MYKKITFKKVSKSIFSYYQNSSTIKSNSCICKFIKLTEKNVNNEKKGAKTFNLLFMFQKSIVESCADPFFP